MAQSTPPTKDPDCFPGDGPCEPALETPDAHPPFAVRPPSMPFAWQHEQFLLLLDQQDRGWTVAELRFEPERLRYIEVRRAFYRWPREAMGVVIARGVRCGETSMAQLAKSVDTWLQSRHADRASRSNASSL
jgi:hypothetical protein